MSAGPPTDRRPDQVQRHVRHDGAGRTRGGLCGTVQGAVAEGYAPRSGRCHNVARVRVRVRVFAAALLSAAPASNMMMVMNEHSIYFFILNNYHFGLENSVGYLFELYKRQFSGLYIWALYVLLIVVC